MATRLFALFVAAALVPLALSDWIASTAVRQIAETLNLGDRARSTRQTSRQVFDRLMTGKTLVTAAPLAMPTTGAAASTLKPPGQGRVLRRFEYVRADDGAVWSSADSTTLVHEWTAAEGGRDDRESPRSTGQVDDVEVRLRAYLPEGRPPRLLLGASHRGELRWIAELEPDYLWAPVVDAGNDSEWWVLDDRGRVLSTFRGGDFPTGRPGHPGRLASADFVESRARLFLGAEFGAGDWVFIQHAPRPQVLWQGAGLATWLSLLAVATLLLVALLGRWQIRRTLVPLAQLTEGTRQLAAGAGGTRVKIHRDDEIGALAGAFNDMAARIEAQFDALEGLAAIDRDILASAPIDRLAGHVLHQLATLYPGASAAVSWLDGDAGLQQGSLSDERGVARATSIERVTLSPEQSARYRNMERDEQRIVAVRPTPADPTREPWLRHACPPGTSGLVLLPLRRRGHTEALLALGLPEVLVPDQLQPARELRDRLAVAFAARAREQELVYRARHDSLTGLSNRYGLHSYLDSVFGTRVAKRKAAVLFVDLDHFKDVNDSRGHEAGDQLLCHASSRLLACAPASAFVARQGGDEFVIVIPEGDEAFACELATNVIEVLARPFALGGGEQMLGASVGIALSPRHGQSREELLRCADIALYAAKAAGRGRYMLFASALDAAAQERVQLQAELRRALQRTEFVVHYQPRVRARDGVIVSSEALIRWQHPERGLLLPDTFIALAESSGLIDGIGHWVLDTACAQAAAWRRQGACIERVSVNVSARQLASAEFAGRVRAVLDCNALPASALELEVTESLLIGDTNEVSAKLAQLRSWGVSIALDDFGTGYSSMATLRQLPIDVMKVDRSFVVDLGVDTGATAVVRAIIALAQSLGLRLVAEGVETEAQASLLRSMGCEEFQGYLYGKPIPPEEFEIHSGAGLAQTV